MIELSEYQIITIQNLFVRLFCSSDTEWTWDKSMSNENTEVNNMGREVTFHKHFSNGTAAIKGCSPLKEGQHYWEIKMTTSVYGTDMVNI